MQNQRANENPSVAQRNALQAGRRAGTLKKDLCIGRFAGFLTSIGCSGHLRE